MRSARLSSSNDNVDSAEMMRDLLAALGHTVELAHDGASALALAATRLIAHTGYGAPQDREKTRDAGFDFHLVKPVSMADLQDALRADGKS